MPHASTSTLANAAAEALGEECAAPTRSQEGGEGGEATAAGGVDVGEAGDAPRDSAVGQAGGGGELAGARQEDARQEDGAVAGDGGMGGEESTGTREAAPSAQPDAQRDQRNVITA